MGDLSDLSESLTGDVSERLTTSPGGQNWCTCAPTPGPHVQMYVMRLPILTNRHTHAYDDDDGHVAAIIGTTLHCFISCSFG